jgi:TRAP-type C4-dicarboxylate transport system substrate-binding protein
LGLNRALFQNRRGITRQEESMRARPDTIRRASIAAAVAVSFVDMLEKGVADAVTFPWGSLILFGIDKVTKYHMDVPFYVTTFALVFNKDKYDQMSASQKKVIDDHCTNEWAGRIGGPWGEFEHAGIAKLKAEPGHDVYALTPEQLAQWKQAAAPLEKSWGDNVRRVGIDPATAMKELKDQLAKYNAGY